MSEIIQVFDHKSAGMMISVIVQGMENFCEAVRRAIDRVIEFHTELYKIDRLLNQEHYNLIYRAGIATLMDNPN